uniref:Uncharacterized protein n=1 Tax=Vitis vinifera TaxID=29760 RepID=F6HKW6_VITVI
MLKQRILIWKTKAVGFKDFCQNFSGQDHFGSGFAHLTNVLGTQHTDGMLIYWMVNSIGDNNAIARRKLRVRAPSVPTNPMI